MSITLAQICDSITETLGQAVGVSRSMSYDELSEGMNDLPALQVYPESGAQDIATSTDRTTFRGGTRQTEFILFADYYARQRSQIGEDMKQLVDGIDGIMDVLETQDTKPYFGLDGIKAFSWTFRRVVFAYGDPAASYIGARFEVKVRVF